MLAGLIGLSTPLAAQSSWSLGFASTLGSNWEIEAGDVGYVREVSAGPIHYVWLGARLGSFVNEGAIVGGVQGFVAGGILQLRTNTTQLADVGNEGNPAPLGLDLTLELGAYGSTDYPGGWPQRGGWFGASLLPGLRFGSNHGNRYSLYLGPSALFGPVTSVHALFGLRAEFSLARHRR